MPRPEIHTLTRTQQCYVQAPPPCRVRRGPALPPPSAKVLGLPRAIPPFDQPSAPPVRGPGILLAIPSHPGITSYLHPPKPAYPAVLWGSDFRTLSLGDPGTWAPGPAPFGETGTYLLPAPGCSMARPHLWHRVPPQPYSAGPRLSPPHPSFVRHPRGPWLRRRSHAGGRVESPALLAGR